MYVIHCWNGCTDMFYNCVIFVKLIFFKVCLKKREKKEDRQTNKIRINVNVTEPSGFIRHVWLEYYNKVYKTCMA